MKAIILHVGIVILSLCTAFAAHAGTPPPPAWVGIAMSPGKQGGVIVDQIVPGSPAAETDLQPGEEITAVDRKEVHTPDALRSEILQRKIGQQMSLTVVGKRPPRVVHVAPALKPSETALLRKRLLGKLAPDFILPRVGSSERGSVIEHRGKPMLIDFWATWCSPCMLALPALNKVRMRFAGKVDVIGVSSESMGTLGPAVVDLGIPYPVYADEKEAATSVYGVTSLPTVVLVDREGYVRDVEVGADPEALIPSIQKLVDEQ